MFTMHAISRRDGGDLDGIHLLWSPPCPTGYAIDGFTIQRRHTEGQDAYGCFDISPVDCERARTQGFTDIAEARVWASPTDQTNPDIAPWIYRVELRTTYHEVRLTGTDAICAFAARADGTMIEGRFFAGGNCRLSGAGIAVVWIVATTPKSQIRICGGEDDPNAWAEARILVEGLQVPFRAVNPMLPDVTAEKELAEERAQPEPLDGDFGEVSRYGNVAYAQAFDTAAWRATTHDPDADRSSWDAAPLGFVLAAGAVEPPWRRALGFAHLDNVDLSDGAVYDYRIFGLVPRADRDERRLDFHTVPRGVTLPRYFRLADLGMLCDSTPVIVAEEAGGDAPNALWKGIQSERIRLFLPHLTERIVLDGRSDGVLDLIGIAGGVDVATLTEPLSGRTVFDFGTPVDEVIVKGLIFATGFIPEPLAPGFDPKEPVEISETVFGVAYVPTAPPDPPTDVAAENLGSAIRAARRGQRDDTIGFEVTWIPPLRLDPGILTWWPADARTAPPTDVATYVLERTWDRRPFSPATGTKGVYVASRNADPITDAIAPGADLLTIYPPANESGLAADERVRAIDALEEDGPEFGTDVTYGVSSVDAIGRRSARALAPPERLEKRTRPPTPVAPPETAPDVPEEEEDALVAPTGVQARLLQASDPDLTRAERSRVDADGDLVLLRWGWGPDQRTLDPHVSEFRVYEAEGKLAEITATISGPPVALVSGGWRLSCSFSRAVNADEFTGVFVVLGLAYKITAHASGMAGTVDLAPAEKDPTRSPVGSEMTLIRTDGSDEEPEAWDSRILVKPRVPDPADPDGSESYEVALPAGWITVSPAERRQIRSFGVSAADSEAYVDDRRMAVEAAPRPGNESPVAAAKVMARHRGRPALVIADLGPVASITLDRAGATGVHLDFTPASCLPAEAAPLSHMRIERGPASAVLPRLVIDAGGIRLADRTGAQTPWVLSPADEAQLRTEAAVRAISDRFLAHAAARLTDIDDAFEKVADADPTRSLRDLVPNSPARWLYRLRAVDAGGTVSAEAQTLELVVRVPRPMRALLPELADLDLTGDTASVTVKARTKDDQVFLAHSNDTRVQVSRADLATVRNRLDLAAADRFFVRDDRGVVLPLTQVTPGEDGSVIEDFSVPERRHFHVWAFAVSADGVPSRLVGPLHAFRGLPEEDA